MPETLGTLIAFLFLVTPGLAFELMRERRRPQREYTAFRETAVVVVASVVFSGVALVILYGVGSWQRSWLPDPGPLIDDTRRYVEANTRLVTRALLIEVVLATALAWFWHQALRRMGPDGKVSANSAWFEVTSGDGNPGGASIVASVSLDGGTTLTGYVRGNDVTKDGSIQDLVLRNYPRPINVRHPNGDQDEVPSDWRYVIIPGSQIRRTTIGLERSATPARTTNRWERAMGKMRRRRPAAGPD